MFIRSALRGIVYAPMSVQSSLHLHGVCFLPHRFELGSPRAVDGMHHETDRNRVRYHASLHNLSPDRYNGGDTSDPPPGRALRNLQDIGRNSKEFTALAGAHTGNRAGAHHA